MKSSVHRKTEIPVADFLFRHIHGCEEKIAFVKNMAVLSKCIRHHMVSIRFHVLYETGKNIAFRFEQVPGKRHQYSARASFSGTIKNAEELVDMAVTRFIVNNTRKLPCSVHYIRSQVLQEVYQKAFFEGMNNTGHLPLIDDIIVFDSDFPRIAVNFRESKIRQ